MIARHKPFVLMIGAISIGASLLAVALDGAPGRSRAQETAPAIVHSTDFPAGTATPSAVCGACHQAIYREYSEGFGSDLHWSAMKSLPSSGQALSLPAGTPASATAHSVAGTDPFPLDAMHGEAPGRSCNICHYPQPLAYPALSVDKVARPVPRPDAHEAGVTCASCHLTPDGKIRGPYALETAAPHATVKDDALKTSVACAACHSDGERVVGKQTQTFLEWREDFMKAGLGPQQCQDCHMPRTTRKLAEAFPAPERVVGRHLWTGGHSFERLRSALQLAVQPAAKGGADVVLHVVNVGAGHSVPTGSNRRAVYLTAEVLDGAGAIVARKEWMFAPWFANRPDDRAFLAQDAKTPEPVAAEQADAQGPHETTIRAGEDRRLDWKTGLAPGRYTVRASLTYDLNRYNDRAFKEDQFEIGHANLALEVGVPRKTASNAARSTRQF